MVFHIFRKLLR